MKHRKKTEKKTENAAAEPRFEGLDFQGMVKLIEYLRANIKELNGALEEKNALLNQKKGAPIDDRQKQRQSMVRSLEAEIVALSQQVARMEQENEDLTSRGKVQRDAAKTAASQVNQMIVMIRPLADSLIRSIADAQRAVMDSMASHARKRPEKEEQQEQHAHLGVCWVCHQEGRLQHVEHGRGICERCVREGRLPVFNTLLSALTGAPQQREDD